MKFKEITELNPEQMVALEQVFYKTSSSKSDNIKYKYFDFYIENYPDFFIVLCEDKQVAGYVCGMADSFENYELFDMFPYLDQFRGSIKKFPAHLHVNVNPDFQGRGVGTKLVEEFIKKLATGQANAKGVHIITTDGALNNKFYNKLGFTHHEAVEFTNFKLLFMGKPLNSDT